MQSVASLLPITADPFPQEPTPGTMPAASGAPQAFKEKMRILAMLGAMGAVGAGTVWVFLG